MPNFQSFFKSKTLLVLIPVLILVLLTVGYFFVSNNSQKAQKTSSQSSISANSPANSISQNPSQGNSTSSNSQSSIFPNSTQNVNSTSSQLSNSKSEISKPEQLFSQNNQIQPLIADAEHDVVVLEDCDLAVRFPKKLGKVDIGIFKRTDDPNKSIRIGSELEDIGDTAKPFIMNSFISCENEEYSKTLNAQKDSKPEFETNIKYEDLIRDTKGNWNLPSISNIQGFSGSSIYSIRSYFFKTQNKKYLIYQTNGSDNPNKLGIYIDQIQLQFNSLAPSVSSVKL